MRKRILRVLSFSLLLTCVACNLNPVLQSTELSTPTSLDPSSPSNGLSLRFRSQTGQFISLNEDNVINILRLNLSNHQFSDDYPFTIKGNDIYLKVKIDDEPTYFVKTDFNQETLSAYCTPNFTLEKLLCESPDGNKIDWSEITNNIADEQLAKELEDAALAQIIHYASEKDFFVISPEEDEIYVLPQRECEYCEFIFKTWCRWVTNEVVQCLTSHGTGIWDTVRFDFETKSYVSLPDNGANIWNLGNFAQGYIQPKSGTNEIAVYNLSGALVHKSIVENWLTTDDSTLLFTEYCDEKLLCFHQLKMDQHGLHQDLQAKLNLSETKNGRCNSYISHTSEEYLVTICNKIFLVTKDALEIIQMVEFDQGEFEDNLVAVHKHNRFLVVTTNQPAFYEGEIYETNGAKIFDLRECQNILSTSCLVKAWDKLLVPDSSGILLTPQEIHYSPLDAPNLVFITNEDAKNLTIYNLGTNVETTFSFKNVPEFITTSIDKDYLLLSTAEDKYAPYKEQDYHLIDLNKMEVVPTKIEIGKNLFFE